MAPQRAGHHLHDRVLDLVGMVDRRVPRDRGGRVPLRRYRLCIQARDDVGPDVIPFVEREVRDRTARFHERAARREPPLGRRTRLQVRGGDVAGA